MQGKEMHREEMTDQNPKPLSRLSRRVAVAKEVRGPVASSVFRVGAGLACVTRLTATTSSSPSRSVTTTRPAKRHRGKRAHTYRHRHRRPRTDPVDGDAHAKYPSNPFTMTTQPCRCRKRAFAGKIYPRRCPHTSPSPPHKNVNYSVARAYPHSQADEV